MTGPLDENFAYDHGRAPIRFSLKLPCPRCGKRLAVKIRLEFVPVALGDSALEPHACASAWCASCDFSTVEDGAAAEELAKGALRRVLTPAGWWTLLKALHERAIENPRFYA